MTLAPALIALGVAGPAFFTVCEVSHDRPFAPLPARWSAVAAALVCACCTAAELAWAGAGTVSFILVAPPVIGVAPWAAGELCSGPSKRQDLAFAAALVAAWAGALAAQWAIGWSGAAAIASAAAATTSYLAVR